MHNNPGICSISRLIMHKIFPLQGRGVGGRGGGEAADSVLDVSVPIGMLSILAVAGSAGCGTGALSASSQRSIVSVLTAKNRWTQSDKWAYTPCLNRHGLFSGSEKGVFWKRGLFRKVHFLEILENSEILEILEDPQTVENKGESDHFLEILENLEILEILEIPPVKRPLS